MVNKKIVIMAVAAVITVGTIIGGTMAAYQASTETNKTISTSSLDVKLNVEGNQVDRDGSVVINSSDIKNGTVHGKVSAVNTGSKSLYVRVRVNKAWYEGQKKIYEKNNKDVNCNTIGIGFINTNDWFVLSDDVNGEDVYIYYKKILKSGEKSSDFMDEFTLLKDINDNTNQYSGLSVKIRFDADAIQTTASKAAMLAEWGIVAEFDNDGRITAINNQ